MGVNQWFQANHAHNLPFKASVADALKGPITGSLPAITGKLLVEKVSHMFVQQHNHRSATQVWVLEDSAFHF